MIITKIFKQTKQKGTIMRRYFIFSVLTLAMLGSAVLAQPRRMQQRPMDRPDRGERWEERGEMRGLLERIPDLSDEQREQLENLHIEHLKAMKPYRDQIAEKRVQLRTLSTAEKVDMGKVNAKIDEISALRTQMTKERAKHQQAVRDLLTEKQRVVFDSMPRKAGHFRGKGFREGRGW